ncbi:MAG: TIGR01212 family radical SAM protein [Bacteroidales bacterium]
MIYSWGTERRFNAYVDHLKDTYGHRIQKVAVDAGFTCPNRDGSLGHRGCTYCDNQAFTPSYCRNTHSITEQIKKGIAFQKVRYKNAKGFFAYFQAYSNTYASLEELKKRYEEALSIEEIQGLVIGTRPDTVDAQKLDYLAELAQEYHITVEYGVESCYNKTLKRIARGHDFETSRKAIEETAKRRLPVGVHLILGLPGESRKDMLKQAKILSQLPVSNLKLHQLQLIKNTGMSREYHKDPGQFLLFDYETYKDFVVDFLEFLSPRIKIERLAGEVPPKFITAGQWDIRNDRILYGIEQQLRKRNTWQGRKYTNL